MRMSSLLREIEPLDPVVETHLSTKPHIPRSTRVCIGIRVAENLGHEPVKREVTRSSPLHLPPRRDSKIKAFIRKGTSLYICPEKP
jgi:hypothetical protein